MSFQKTSLDQTKVNRYIEVTGQYEGFHTYENAPDEVAFLRNRHRHLFKWTAFIQVFHDDRELEFFMVKTQMEREILPFIRMMDNLGSCEMQAERIALGLVNSYGDHRYLMVTVSEDDENAGSIEYDPHS